MKLLTAILTLLGTSLFGVAGSLAVTESQREIPIAYDVDVVVVGGTSGAASAAISAAQAGAKVFLVAPRPYLGDDMCETRRLWLEEGETPESPLARKLFAPDASKTGAKEAPAQRDPNALAFTYTASIPSSKVHKDSTPPSKLTDGLWMQASAQSVQYDGEVTLVADLGSVKEIKEARVVVFHRDSDFECAPILVETSRDKQSWQRLAVLRYEDALSDAAVLLSTAVSNQIRYARFTVKPADGSKRVLLGEIMLVAPGKSDPAAKASVPTGPRSSAPLVRPMQIKRTLDEALLEAKVDFLFSSFATELLRDAEGNPCGIVMANRAGRQAVVAKVIIDATPRAIVARMAGAKFAPFPAGEQTFTRIAMGGEPASGSKFTSRKLGQSFKTIGGLNAPPNREAELVEYTLRLPMRDASFASFAEAD